MDEERYKAFTIHNADPEDVNSVIAMYLKQHEADGSVWRLHSLGMLPVKNWYGVLEMVKPALLKKVDTQPSEIRSI